MDTKILLLTKLHQLVEDNSSDLTLIDKLYHPNAHWRGSHPLNEIHTSEAIKSQVWQPLKVSFPDLEKRDLLVLSGDYEGRSYIANVSHYCGTFVDNWLGIPASGKTIYLRAGEVHQIEGDKIIQSTVLFDILDVMRQVGYYPLPPSLGAEQLWQAPIHGNRQSLNSNPDIEQSQKSLTLTLAMHQSLSDYDDTLDNSREGYLNMPQKQFWHPKMMWYGPCGIGTARGLSGFVDHHQRPFRIAFPNRIGTGHYVRIGDGNFSVTGGWPSVRGNHLGDSWLGIHATGKTIDMRVMDFYYIDQGLIRENWVPIDIIDICLQMGIDLFVRMHQLVGSE